MVPAYVCVADVLYELRILTNSAGELCGIRATALNCNPGEDSCMLGSVLETVCVLHKADVL